MKKNLIMLLLTMFLFIPVISIYEIEASQGGQLLKDNQLLIEEISSLQSSHLLKQFIVIPNGSFQRNDAMQMIGNISKIHPAILEKVVEKNLKLKLFTGSLTDQPGFTHLKGVKPRGYVRYTWDDVPGAGGTKVALAKIGHSAKGKGHGSINLELHEIAHTIDRHVFDSIRNKSDFIEIWEAEASILFPGQPYFLDNPEEYFAETFAMYYLSFFTRAELYIHSPRTYEYIQKLEDTNSADTNVVTLFN
jgi:Pro-Pro endopeptidase